MYTNLRLFTWKSRRRSQAEKEVTQSASGNSSDLRQVTCLRGKRQARHVVVFFLSFFLLNRHARARKTECQSLAFLWEPPAYCSVCPAQQTTPLQRWVLTRLFVNMTCEHNDQTVPLHRRQGIEKGCSSVTNLCLTLLRPHGLQSSRLLCPWNFLGKNTGVGCHFLLQGIFPDQDQIQVSCTGRQILYHWATRAEKGPTYWSLFSEMWL